MSAPSIIYKKFHKYKPIQEFKGHQWFALEDNYGADTYGAITKSYNFKKPPKLLDIGDADVRIMIEDEIKKTHPELVKYCHPDEQYSGTTGNKKCHSLIQEIFGQEYDGTIINIDKLKGNSKYTIGDLEGATEIVIWKDYPDLLEEIQEELHEEEVPQKGLPQKGLSDENIGKGINKLKRRNGTNKKGRRRNRTNKKGKRRRNRTNKKGKRRNKR
jgi:hypothetical protein